MPAAGDLRHRLVLIRPVRTADTHGALEETSTTSVATVWAQVEGLSGRERLAGDRGLEAEVSHRVTMRYRADVKPTWRMHWGRRVLEIVRVFDPTGRRQWLEIETLMRAENRGAFAPHAFSSGFDVSEVA